MIDDWGQERAKGRGKGNREREGRTPSCWLREEVVVVAEGGEWRWDRGRKAMSAGIGRMGEEVGEAEAETEAGSWSCGTGNAEEVVLAAEVAGTEVAGTAEAAVAAVVAAKEGQSWAVVVRTTTSERLLHS